MILDNVSLHDIIKVPFVRRSRPCALPLTWPLSRPVYATSVRVWTPVVTHGSERFQKQSQNCRHVFPIIHAALLLRGCVISCPRAYRLIDHTTGLGEAGGNCRRLFARHHMTDLLWPAPPTKYDASTSYTSDERPHSPPPRICLPLLE